MSEDDRRLGAYAPPPDQFDTFDAREDGQDRRGWLFLGATAVVFALFVAVVTNTYLLGVRERGESPIITADAEPYRIAPDNPGGYQTPDQDLTVHDLRSAGAEQNERPDAREPMQVREQPVLDTSDNQGRDSAMPDLRVETADADTFSEPPPAQTDAFGSDSNPVIAPAVSQDEPGSGLESAIAAALNEQAEAAPVEPRIDPRPAPPVSAPTQSGDRLNGDFLAQIAAFRSEADAMDAWRDFAAAMPDLALGREPDIQRADLGDRGVFYRLRISGFETRAQASAYCAQLQARNQACLVARR